MRINCAVKGCLNRLSLTKGHVKVSYHKFPMNPQCLVKWIKFCGWYDGWQPRPSQSVCSDHFEPSCYTGQPRRRRKLKISSIPTIPPRRGTIGLDYDSNAEGAEYSDDQIADFIEDVTDHEIKIEDYTRIPSHRVEVRFDHIESKSDYSDIQSDTIESNNRDMKSRSGYSEIQSNDTLAHTKLNNCKICRSELSDSRYLYEQVVENKSYMDIIKENLYIAVNCDGHGDLWICVNCSSFIENLHSFVKLCRQALSQMETKVLGNSETKGGESIDCGTYVLEKCIPQLQEMEEDMILKQIKIEPVEPNDPSNEHSTDPVLEGIPTASDGYSKQCDICGVFIKQDLQLHRNTHFNETVKCDVCGKLYANSRQLQVHLNIHTKNITYPCLYCDKVFYVWKSQKDHEKTHLDIINNVEHRCSKCDNVYSCKRQLDVHFKLKHLGIRNHACKYCPYKTNQKDRLLHHVRATHTDKRPYGCVVCGFLTSNEANLFTHVQRHRKKGEAIEYCIKCAYCGMIFQKNATFEAHLVNAHPDEAVVI